MKGLDLKDQQIVLVTGKGGVGKSTVAAAIAKRESQRGRKTLLVELGEESYYEHFFHLNEIKYFPQEIGPQLYLSQWDVEPCLREYVLHFIKIERLYRIFFENKVMKTFIRATPAISELAILGKITSNYRHHGPPLPFDVIVVDAYSTGHFLSLLRAPQGLSEAIRSGPFGEQSSSIMKTLLNPTLTAFVLVTLPEMLPVTETLELKNTLKTDFGIEPNIICNRVMDLPLEEEPMNRLSENPKVQVMRPFLLFLKHVLQRQNEALGFLTHNFSDYLVVRQSHGSYMGHELSEFVAKEIG